MGKQTGASTPRNTIQQWKEQTIGNETTGTQEIVFTEKKISKESLTVILFL